MKKKEGLRETKGRDEGKGFKAESKGKGKTEGLRKRG